MIRNKLCPKFWIYSYFIHKNRKFKYQDRVIWNSPTNLLWYVRTICWVFARICLCGPVACNGLTVYATGDRWMNISYWWDDKLGRVNRNPWRKTCLSTTFSNKSHTSLLGTNSAFAKENWWAMRRVLCFSEKRLISENPQILYMSKNYKFQLPTEFLEHFLQNSPFLLISSEE